MKRFIPFVVIFLLAIGVYAYFEGGKKSDLVVDGHGSEREEPIRESQVLGMITSLGSIAVPGSGTHLLTRPDLTTVLLAGLGANLDEYLEKMVEVEGRLTQTPSGKDLIQVLRVRLAEDQTMGDTVAVSDAWEDFEEKTLGLKFRRRGNWEVAQTPILVTFTLPTDCKEMSCSKEKAGVISIEKIANDKNQALNTFTGDAKISTKNLIGPRKLLGYRHVDLKTGAIIFVVAREKSVFKLMYTPGIIKAVDEGANDFYSMISSFEFAPVVLVPKK